jgi:hypothetical protein
MTNIVKELEFNPICKDKFYWSAVDEEMSDRGLLTKPN